MTAPDDPLAAALAEIERLRADNARLSELLDMAQDFGRLGVWERDPKTLEGRWDRHVFRLFGFAEGKVPHFAEAARRVHPDDRIDDRFASTFARPGSHDARYRIVRDDGSIAHIHSQWRVIADAQGQAARVVGVMVDDTEPRAQALRNEAALAQLELALSLAGIGLWRHDLATDRLHHDERSQAMLGRAMGPEGVSLDTVRDWIHPDDLPAVKSAFEQAMTGVGMVDTRTRYRHADGRWLTLLVRRVLQRDADGRPAAVVGVGMDVTDFVAQTSRTIELAQRLDAAADAARIGLWTAPLDGSVPEWNSYMHTLLGLDPRTPALGLGEALRRVLHADDRERVARDALAWVHGPAPSTYEAELRIVRADDARVRWVQVRGRLAFDAEGRRRAYGVLLDVTEQRDALDRLREANERATLALSSVGMGTWSHDAATGLDDWDAQMFRLRGLEPAPQAPGEAERLAFVHPDDRAALDAAAAALLTSHEPLGYEFRIVRADGAVRTLASRSVALLGADGRVRQRIGVNWDVTEAREAERLQRERELAQREARTRAVLFSRLSHELRTPLNAILGFTQLMRAEGEGGSVAQRRAWLPQIQAAGEQLLGLVDGVLELNELADLGDGAGAAVRVALGPVLARAAEALRLSAAQRGVRIDVGAEAMAFEVLGDERRLGLALGHLLRFALRRSPSGAAVAVTARLQGGEVQLRVTDRGRTIDVLQARALFEPLGVGPDSGEADGNGRLGAALAQAQAARMGARVQFERSDDAGTTLVLGLRRFVAAAPAAAAGARRALLYIEDNEVNMMIVRELLGQRPDLVFHGAADGRSGLALAHELRPALVLIDMQLPDIDGMAVLRRLRADPATAALTCVALSANAMPEDMRGARAAGFDDYWTKPIDLSAFLQALDRLLPTA